MAKFELYQSSNGEYRWRLRADNGNIIATGGEGYASKATAKAGIESVKKNAPAAGRTRGTRIALALGCTSEGGPSCPIRLGRCCWV